MGPGSRRPWPAPGRSALITARSARRSQDATPTQAASIQDGHYLPHSGPFGAWVLDKPQLTGGPDGSAPSHKRVVVTPATAVARGGCDEPAGPATNLQSMSTIAEPSKTGDFSSEIHVYEPHKVGLPPLGPYLRQLWRRREFAFELARSDLRSKHFNTALGQLWLILNPLLLGLVLFALVQIIGRRGGTAVGFAYLLLALFAFRLVSTSINQGARSVVGGGRLILNTAFPRTLLPLSSVLTCFMLFLPTLGVYAIVHLIAGLPVTPQILWAIPIIGAMVVFAAGGAMLVAAVQVYFRDLTSFLRYFLRIWLYVSPVLWIPAQVPEKYKPLLYANPLYPPLTALSDAVNLGVTPRTNLLLLSFAWAVGALVVGSLFFISREREFAVRL